MGKTPRQQLFHGVVIIGTCHRPDTEFPVIVFLGTPFLKYHHGPHRLKPIDIRNVIRFYPVQPLKTQKPLDLFHGSQCLFSLLLKLLGILGKNHMGIALCQIQQPHLFSPLRMSEHDLMSPFFRQPFQNRPAVLWLTLRPEFPRHIGGPRIHLLDEGA